MALVNIREVENDPSAESFEVGKNEDLFFAQDWNAFRDTLVLGLRGVTTRQLRAEDVDVGTYAEVGGLYTGGSTTVSGSVFLRKVTTVRGNITGSGTVGQVNMKTHSHNDVTTSRVELSSSMDGATKTWVRHDHNNDGSSTLGGGAVQDGVLERRHIGAELFGFDSNNAVEGSTGKRIENQAKAVFNYGHPLLDGSPTPQQDFPPGGVFVDLHSMGGMTTSHVPGDLGSGGSRLVTGNSPAYLSYRDPTDYVHFMLEANGGGDVGSNSTTFNSTWINSDSAINTWPSGPTWTAQRLVFNSPAFAPNAMFSRFQVLIPGNAYNIRIRVLYMFESSLSQQTDLLHVLGTFIPIDQDPANIQIEEATMNLNTSPDVRQPNRLYASDYSDTIFNYDSPGGPAVPGIAAFELYMDSTIHWPIFLLGAHITYDTTLI